jgi:hypothetical protein
LLSLFFAFPVWAQNCPPVDQAKQSEGEKACRAAGGEWGRVGNYDFLCGIYSCVRRTQDGGKPCHGRGDCEYLCLSKRELPIGTAVTGECASRVTQFGCQVHVEGGKVVGRICVD